MSPPRATFFRIASPRKALRAGYGEDFSMKILVAGAGAIGASIAYHLALRGARDVLLCDRGRIASGATSKAMGGVRQQFSTAPEVRLARASIAFFEELGPPFFEQVGYLFLATTEAGLAELDARREVQAELGVPVERVDPSFVDGLRTEDVLGAVLCATDGVGDPPAVTHELVRRAAERGVDVREDTAAEELDSDLVVIACGPHAAEVAARYGVELPIRPLCRQLLQTSPIDGLPERLPMTVEVESGFHFRRRGDTLVIAMADPAPRWGFEERVDESVFEDRLERLAHRYRSAGGARVDRAWAGLYDMTPDAHPIIGQVADGVYAACGFSGHGFMQSPAVGRALADEIVDGGSDFDLSPFRLERFESGAIFPETLVL
jgi:sarcosine oxidase subunit beta